MKTSNLLTFAAITAVISLVLSCGKSVKNDAVTNIVWKKNDYASLFKLGTAGKDSFLEVYNNDSSVLGKFFWGESDSVAGYRKISNRNRIVSLAAPYTFMLTELGVAGRIVGVDNLDYIGHPAWLQPAAEGKDISESGIADAYKKLEVYSKSGRLLPEKLKSVKPDVVIGYWTTPDDQEFAEGMTKKQIPFIWCQNWLENHPLGRSEWILAFGWITGNVSKAESLFTTIKTDYLKLAEQTKAADREEVITVAANVPYPNGSWFMPVKSDLLYTMVADAGAELIALDKDKSMATMSMEKAIGMVKNASIWINTDMYNNAKQLELDNPSVGSIKAFKDKHVYHYNSVKNNFRNPYWDRGNMYCNEVLADLITIINEMPDAGKSQQLHYYRNAFK